MILNIELSDSVATSSPEDFSREIRLAAAAQLYGQGRISSGRAAQLAGIGRVEFLASLERLGVSALNIGLDDFEKEAAFVARHL